MRTVGVVGLGAMGLGIALVFCAAGRAVLATDAREAARDEAHGRLAQRLADLISNRELREEEADAILGRLIVVDGPGSMASADLVVEAVTEDLAAKRVVFSALERVLAPGAVVATNTSSLSVASLARGMRHPERVIGLHFFNPAPATGLVELVRHPGTGEEAAARGRSAAERAGQTVVEAPDTPGFIVNRLARSFYCEALALLDEGRGAAEIDAAVLAAGYRRGPFSLVDLVGADIGLAAARRVAQATGDPPRYHVLASIEGQVASGERGRRARRGVPHPERPAPAPADAMAVAARIEAALVNEAGWLLSEGGATAEGIDTATTLGLNFPRGPFELLSARGRTQVRATLAAMAAGAPAHLRGRYLPAPLLEAP